MTGHDWWIFGSTIAGWEAGNWLIRQWQSWRERREFAAMKARMDILLDPDQTPIPEPGSYPIREYPIREEES